VTHSEIVLAQAPGRGLQWVQLSVFAVLFLLVTVLGFFAAR
jgi:SSS family solute:Na+ symporter